MKPNRLAATNLVELPPPRVRRAPTIEDAEAEARKNWGDRAMVIERDGTFHVVYVMGYGETPWSAFIDAEGDRCSCAFMLASDVHRLAGGES